MDKILINSTTTPIRLPHDPLEIDFQTDGHILFSGDIRSGKTTGIKNIIKTINNNNKISFIYEFGKQPSQLGEEGIPHKHLTDNRLSDIEIEMKKRYQTMKDHGNIEMYNNAPIILYFNKPTPKLLERYKDFYRYLRGANIITIIEVQKIEPEIQELIRNFRLFFNLKVSSVNGLGLPGLVRSAVMAKTMPKEFNPLHFNHDGQALFYTSELGLAVITFPDIN